MLETLHFKVVAFTVVCVTGWILLPHIQTNVCKFGIFQKEIFYLIFIKFLLYNRAYYALVSKLHSCYLICISLLINEEVKQFDINKD